MRMKEDHMGNGQLKPAYNVQLAVNSEYITGVAAFSNCTDSGTLIPFLNHIQRMQGQSYRDIVADADMKALEITCTSKRMVRTATLSPPTTRPAKPESTSSRLDGWTTCSIWNGRIAICVPAEESFTSTGPVPGKMILSSRPVIITAAPAVPAVPCSSNAPNRKIRTTARKLSSVRNFYSPEKKRTSCLSPRGERFCG